ncbi:unannotated protein [freshwater metagenome]|uniref:Unannotated protein n=1 Tax=freshwater metagenome TaxID=449393 RepID=A0A6J6F4J7_9ZZZZ
MTIGLARLDANFAMNFDVATPTLHGSSSSSAMRFLIRCPIAVPSPKRLREPVTSRNASSRAMGSMCGVKSAKIACTCRLTSEYNE